MKEIIKLLNFFIYIVALMFLLLVLLNVEGTFDNKVYSISIINALISLNIADNLWVGLGILLSVLIASYVILLILEDNKAQKNIKENLLKYGIATKDKTVIEPSKQDVVKIDSKKINAYIIMIFSLLFIFGFFTPVNEAFEEGHVLIKLASLKLSWVFILFYGLTSISAFIVSYIKPIYCKEITCVHFGLSTFYFLFISLYAFENLDKNNLYNRELGMGYYFIGLLIVLYLIYTLYFNGILIKLKKDKEK